MLLIAILFSILLPASSHLQSYFNKINTTHKLINSIHTSRNLSQATGKKVMLCQKEQGVYCQGLNWQKGWVIFIDENQNATFDTNDTLMQTQAPLNKNIKIQFAFSFNNSKSSLTFYQNGLLNNGSFYVCANSADPQESLVRIVINRSGRAYSKENNLNCGNIN